MRALSLTRPWPHAILHLGKRIENRSDKRGMPPMCKYRGPLLLHAAKSWDDGAIPWMIERGLKPLIPTDGTWSGSDAYPAGGIVGRCLVTGHIEPGADGLPLIACNGLSPDSYAAVNLDLRWWMGSYALVLADVEPLPFVACRGALGLWKVPADVLEALGLSEVTT